MTTPHHPLTHQTICAAVDTLVPDLFGFIQTLVRTPSLPNEEGAVQAIVAKKLATLGLTVDIVPTRFDELADHPAFNDDGFSPDNRINVIGCWPAKAQPAKTQPDAQAAASRSDTPRHGSLILNGHVDVVSPGDTTLWTRSPWSGEIHNGRLYGRGACDMKAGLSAAIFALAALKELSFTPAYDILLQSVIGEESGGVGALTTIVQGYRATAAIIMEPTRLALCPLQAGALTFRLTVAGKAAHAAMKSEGVSAIDKFMLLNAALNELNQVRHAAYQNPLYDNPDNVAPISIGTVQSGEWHSTVPERLVAEGRCGVFPGENVDEVRARLAATICEAAATDPWLRDNPPALSWFEGQFEAAETDMAHPMVQALLAQHAATHGAPPSVEGVTYGADMRLYTNHAQIPTVLYGPGDVRLAHAVDESIALDEVVAATKTLALTVYDWCGGEMKSEE